MNNKNIFTRVRFGLLALARIFHEHILTADALQYSPASASIS